MSDSAASPAVDHPVVRARWFVLALLLGLSGWLMPGAMHLQHDEDVLAFLPPEHPDVVAFRRVAERFGMLEIALVGLRSDEPLLTTARTEKVRTLHTKLSEVPGVTLVLSYPEFPEAKVVDDTLVVDALVPRGIEDDEELRRRVLGSPDAVGNFISAHGDAAAILVYLAPVEGQSRAHQRAQQLGAIRQAVAEHWDGESYFGGAPFLEYAAATSSREDIERLSPIVIGVLAVTSALLLGSITAAMLNLIITGIGVGLIVGAHGVFAEPFTIVSSTTPVMMVALGGAFGMHMLAGFQRKEGTSRARASATLRELWRPVVLSGLTTATAFFALQVMPQVPMQRFGVVAGLGVLLLLVLALVTMPAVLAVLPSGWLRTRANPHLPVRWIPPLWLVVLIGIVGAGLGTQLRAEPDTTEMFGPDSGPRRADAFFNEYFGGSQFLMVAIEADLTQPPVLREIRTLVDELRAVEGVADVRSLLEPVAIVAEGFGGRRGIPQSHPRARRVISNLADHPAMKQLMRTDGAAAIVHIKLVPGGGELQQRVTEHVRAIVATHARSTLPVGDAQSDVLKAVVRDAVRARISRAVGREITADRFDEIVTTSITANSMLEQLRELRDRALGTDEIVQPVPDAERIAVEPTRLFELRGEALESYLKSRLPTLVANDPEGVGYVAEFLGQWIDEAAQVSRFAATCDALGIPGGEQPGSTQCHEIQQQLSELSDTEWTIPAGVVAEVQQEHAWSVTLTGQPVIGQAFAQSVATSLRDSTLVSIGALALVLLLFGQLRTLVPALWTLMLTAGAIALFGHPISIGTSMVACIALGAGVDFAIHLGVRARQSAGANPGQDATEALGGVILVTGVQLAAAFLVLLTSDLPPLQQFGSGLAVGLFAAAVGSVWLTPRLYRGR